MRCAACGHANPDGARFCNACGAQLVTAVPSVARKQITVLFSDLSGFTTMSEQLEPEIVRELLDPIFRAAARIIEAHGGRVDKLMGDAVMAVFGDPVAHEDDAERAVRATLELHRFVDELSPQIAERAGVVLRLHSGLNTGLAVLADRTDVADPTGPLGDPINVAARLQARAQPGEILIGQETMRAIGRRFDVEELGVTTVRGRAADLAVARVIGETSRVRTSHRLIRTLVGRADELSSIAGALDRIERGEPCVVVVRGEAGSGKTRLVDEVRAQRVTRVRWLDGSADVAETTTPFATVIDLFARFAGIERDDPRELVRHKLDRTFADRSAGPSTAPSTILRLFDLDTGDSTGDRQAFPSQLLDDVVEFLDALAAESPTVVCLHDLHWADPSTRHLVLGLAARIGTPWALLCTSREPVELPATDCDIVLEPLPPAACAAMISELLDGAPPPGIVELVTARADGNPFFIEEIVTSIIENGTIRQQPGGWELAGPLAADRVPTTVRSLIAARLDRLSADERAVLTRAAVVGREFDQAILSQLVDDDHRPEAALPALVDTGLIERVSDPGTYSFRHALTQEVAYDAIVERDRRELHLAAARIIESATGTRAESAESVAHHYSRAGADDLAVPYLVEAGDRAVARYALIEADTHYREAYETLATATPTVEQAQALSRLIVSWVQVHYYRSTVSEWRSLMQTHLPDAERAEDVVLLGKYLGWLGHAHQFGGDLETSGTMLDRAASLTGDPLVDESAAYVLAWRSGAALWSGRPERAAAMAEPLVTLGAGTRDPYPWFSAARVLGESLVMLGELGRAGEIARTITAHGVEAGNARCTTIGLYLESMTAFFALDFEYAIDRSDAAIAAADDPAFQATGSIPGALAASAIPDMDHLRTYSDMWAPMLRESGNVWFSQTYSGAGAAIAMERGSLTRGMHAFERTITEIRERGYLIEAHVADILSARLYLGVARREVMPRARSVIRNPHFVVRHALGAEGRAERIIGRCRERAAAQGYLGSLGLIELLAAELALHRKDRAAAEQAAAQLDAFFARAEVTPTRRVVEVTAALAAR